MDFYIHPACNMSVHGACSGHVLDVKSNVALMCSCECHTETNNEQG